MRNLKKVSFFASVILLISFFGCKKVIDVKLKDSTSQIVITGEVNNRTGPYHVAISKSVDFTSDNTFPPVSGAFVTIASSGFVDTLTEKKPGDYITHSFIGTPGFTYQLYVETEGKVFTASSTMPQPVDIDSISFVEGINDNIYAVVNFQDPPGIANFYQFIEYANNIAFSNGRGNSIFDDRLSDGRYINRVLYDNDSTDIKPGIKLTVELKCVDENVYNYLNGLLQSSANGGSFASPTPANPSSNITGGALGYFTANTKTSRSVEIP